MKKIFRKAMTIAGSAALIGMTIGSAAAAAYPAPFTANTAIVVGASAAPSDNIAAASIATNLNANAVSGAVTVIGGDSFKLEKTSVNYNLGDSMVALATSLDEDDMPTALADGVYKDDNREEYDYEQKITVQDANLTLFTDTKYEEKEPTLGFNFVKNANVLDYTITFKDGGIDANAIVGTDLPLMGREYYVLSATNGSGIEEMELLDSSATSMVTDGVSSSITVGGNSYSVSVDYISLTEVKLNINGEATDKLSDGESYELDDGSYVAIKEILYAEKETGISKVEFSIGAGKLKIVSGDDIEINDETIDGVKATLTFGDTLTLIEIEWTAGEEIFLTEADSVAVMPGFEALQVIYGGLDFPTAEITELDAGDQLTLVTTVKDGSLDLEVLDYDANGNISLGGDDYDLVYAVSNDLDLNLSDYFVVSSSADSGEEYATYAYELGKVMNTSSTTEIRLDSISGGSDITFDEIGAEEEVGDVLFTLVSFNNDVDSAVINVTAVTGTDAEISTQKVYTAAGLTIHLPSNVDENSTTTTFVFEEADKDGKTEAGINLTVTVAVNPDETAIEATTRVITAGAGNEVSTLNDNEEIGYLYSELATSYIFNSDATLNEFTVSYYGDEVIADVQIASGETTTSTEAGVMTVKDSEVATVAGKNLVVVGGSAINSVAADLLGGAYREAAFTEATGVADGQFLIQSFDRSGKTALLVAGYSAADTEKAVTYLLNNDVDTTVGEKVIKTSATEATVI
jgi:hypothetical protein